MYADKGRFGALGSFFPLREAVAFSAFSAALRWNVRQLDVRSIAESKNKRGWLTSIGEAEDNTGTVHRRLR